MDVPPPSIVVPSCAGWELGGARQTSLNPVTEGVSGPERTRSYVRTRTRPGDRARRDRERPATPRVLLRAKERNKLSFIPIRETP